jgi:hypothetical protein
VDFKLVNSPGGDFQIDTNGGTVGSVYASGGGTSFSATNLVSFSNLQSGDTTDINGVLNLGSFSASSAGNTNSGNSVNSIKLNAVGDSSVYMGANIDTYGYFSLSTPMGWAKMDALNTIDYHYKYDFGHHYGVGIKGENWKLMEGAPPQTSGYGYGAFEITFEAFADSQTPTYIVSNSGKYIESISNYDVVNIK